MSLRLEVSDISKSYDGKHVLKDCSFVFDNGIYALMGPNGCGKSTFMRICALLENPDRGRVAYFSEAGDVRQDINLRRRISLVLPGIGLFNTSVFKNVAYGLKIRGMQKKSIEEKTKTMLEFVGLSGKSRQNALTLSSGESQRLGIARAMVIVPEILFLDEPTASVDQENTWIIEGIILKMKRDRKTTVVIATHDREQAERLADRIISVRDGKISVYK